MRPNYGVTHTSNGKINSIKVTVKGSVILLGEHTQDQNGY